MAHLYYGLYLHYLPTARLLSHVLCQLGGPPGRSRWLWTLMNFTSNFDALISMVLRFKLRLDVIFMQARARAVHGVNPRLFCTLTKCFRERNIRLICDQSSQMIRIRRHRLAAGAEDRAADVCTDQTLLWLVIGCTEVTWPGRGLSLVRGVVTVIVSAI